MSEESASIATTNRLGAPARLWNRDYAIFWQAQFVSRLGDQAFLIALALWVSDVIGSATLMGLLLAAANVPSLILTPVGGAIADRYSRRSILILTDAVRGLLLLILASGFFLLPQQHDVLLILLFVVAIGQDVAGAFFGPAASAAIPALVPAERVASANSLGQLSAQVAVFIGQAFGGTLYRLLGPPLMLLVDSLSCLYAAASSAIIRIPQQLPETGLAWRDNLRAFTADLKDGLRYVWGAPGLKGLVLISALGNFFTTPILLLLPFYIREYLAVPEDWYGYLLAAFGVGSVLGYGVVSAITLTGRTRAVVMLVVMIVDALTYGALGWTQYPWAALAVAVLSGATSAFLTVNIVSLVQITTPDGMRGRVMGLLSMISSSITPIAMGLGGVVADQTGRNIPLIFSVCSGILLLLALVIAASPAIRAFLAYEPGRAPSQP